MHFALTDILAVTVICLVAVLFLIRLFVRMRKDKCVTVCNGCSGSSCSTKSFAKVPPLKSIEIHKV